MEFGHEEGRFRELDMYKGFAILGVIVSHMVLLQMGAGDTTGSPNTFNQFMYSGLIMFIVISGFFYRPGRSYLENVKKRVVPFLLIFIAATVILTVIMFGYMVIIGYDLSQFHSLGEVIWNVITSKGVFLDWTTDAYQAEKVILAPFEVTIMMYYLQMLVMSYLIFFAIADKVLKNWKITVIAILILFGISSVYCEYIHIMLPFYMHLAPMGAGFLLTGALVAKTDFRTILTDNIHDRRFWIIMAVSLAIGAIFLFVFPANVELTTNIFGKYGAFNIYAYAIKSLACGFFQITIVAIITKIPGISHLFTAMGRNILYLFLLHMFIGKLIIAPFVTIGVDKWIPLSLVPSLILVVGTIATILVMSAIYVRLKEKMNKITCEGVNQSTGSE